MREPATETDENPALPLERKESRLDPAELARWFEDRRDTLVERWLSELTSRSPGESPLARSLQIEFFHLLTSFLRDCLGPEREQVDTLWRQTAVLYGNVAAMRGLASGEVIEEFQLLRESIIRLVYSDPPGGGHQAVSLREVLRVNRFLDRGVTHAGIGHTDSLFFAHFQGTGVAERLGPEHAEEVRVQLAGIEAEYRVLRRKLNGLRG
jgi:hypothetical protein